MSRMLQYKLIFLLILAFSLSVLGCGNQSSHPEKKNTTFEELKNAPLPIKQLITSPYLSVRNTALEELKKNPNLYLPTLKKLLLHEHPYVRTEAAKILGKMGEGAKDLVSELTRTLDDSDIEVKTMSSWALGKIVHPSPQTISKLIPLLRNTKDPNERNDKGHYNDREDKDVILRQNTALALSRLAPQATNATHFLIDIFLYDPNSQVRLNAALALEKMAPHIQCDHISIAQTMQEISNRIYLYASLCFRPERSLEEGATSKEILAYYLELKKEFIPANFNWEKDSFPSRSSLTVSKKYTNEAILSCAQQNFSYLSTLDKQWFQVFDRYSYTKEKFKPFQEEWLRIPLISIANTHPLAVSHGKILFELAQFIHNHQKTIPTLLVEDAYSNYDDAQEYFDDLQEDFQYHPTLKSTESLSYVQELNQIDNLASDYTLASSRWLNQPRDQVEEIYALTYPSAEIIPVDLGKERISDVCGVYLSTLQNLIDHRKPSETFLLFYGSAHIARVGINDSSEIESKIKCNNEPLKTFTIGQFSSPNALLEKALDLSLLYEAQNIPAEKFSFPIKNPISDIDSFLSYWTRMVDKYNSRRSNSHLPLYVYLSQAQKNNALSFFNSVAPYDLFLIPAAEDSAHPWNIRKDKAYLFLKEYLENHIQKLSWISN